MAINDGKGLNYHLNRLAGTLSASGYPTYGAAAAANKWAGTKGLDLQGALNAKAGTKGLAIQGALNKLAGTKGLGIQGAASRIVS